MKKIIALFIVTVICAGIFVGCGSGESTTSSIVSSQRVMISNFLPHNTKVMWDRGIYGVVLNDDVKIGSDGSYAVTTYKPTIGSTAFDSMIYNFADNGNIIGATYFKTGNSADYKTILNAMNALYGKSSDTDKLNAWNIEFPNGEKGSVNLLRREGSEKNISLTYIKFSSSTTSETNTGYTTSSKSTNSSKSTSSAKPSTPPKAETPKTPTVTTGQKNALKSAQQYLNIMSFSYKSLVEQLEYEQYSHADATYAADNCGANWNEQAAKSAKDYLEIMSFSRQGLIEQLEYEGFTHAQAVYGVDQAGL